MSPSTVFLSRLIGILAILVSLSMFLHEQSNVEAATALTHGLPLSLITGMIVLICGLAIVLSHNVWSGGILPVVIILFGWSILIRGALLLFLSPEARVNLFETLHLGELFPFSAAINLILGLYLTYAGFKAALASRAGTKR